MKWYSIRTVQKGKELATPEAVKKRLKEINQKRTSSYHKALKEDRIIVLVENTPGRKRGPYTIIEATSMTGEDAECPNCGSGYYNLEDDYLCPTCREATES